MKKKIMNNVILLLISILVILIFSESTSPLYDNIYLVDSATFQIIGKGITEGYIPYKDLFDHKGPILFFIQALGIIINEKIGIFILQIINYFIFIFFINKMINILTKIKHVKIVSLLLTIIASINFLWEGNSCEEWSLSLISIELYIICKGLKKDTFYKKDYVISGIIFSIISLIRLNNAATVVGFIIFSFLHYLRKKDIRQILIIVFYFILGCLIIYIPILIYFYKNDAIYEMFYATFIFNFKYGIHKKIFSDQIITNIVVNVPMIFLLILIFKSSYCPKIKNCFYNIIFWNILAVSVGYTFIHYYLILVPIFPILIIETLNFIKKYKNKKIKILDIIPIYLIISVLILYILSMSQPIFKENKRKIPKEILNNLNDINHIIKDEKEILCYGLDSICYKILNKNPSSKYFLSQEWHSQHDESLKKEMTELLNTEEIRYIITNKNYNYEWIKNYNLIYYNDLYNLYKLKQN